MTITSLGTANTVLGKHYLDIGIRSYRLFNLLASSDSQFPCHIPTAGSDSCSHSHHCESTKRSVTHPVLFLDVEYTLTLQYVPFSGRSAESTLERISAPKLKLLTMHATVDEMWHFTSQGTACSRDTFSETMATFLSRLETTYTEVVIHISKTENPATPGEVDNYSQSSLGTDQRVQALLCWSKNLRDSPRLQILGASTGGLIGNTSLKLIFPNGLRGVLDNPGL